MTRGPRPRPSPKPSSPTWAKTQNGGGCGTITPSSCRTSIQHPTRLRSTHGVPWGADVFVESALSSGELGKSLQEIASRSPLGLKMISNRGCKVYPPTGAITDCVDHWRCRFVVQEEATEMADSQLLDLLHRSSLQHRWMHIEKLHEFDGVAGYTKAQGKD